MSDAEVEQLRNEVDNLNCLVSWLETRLETALDGNGIRPWSEEYLRQIIRECLEHIRE